MTAPDSRRRAELVARLAAVRGRLSDACAGVGRDPRAVTLVAITKGFPASDIAALAGIGVTDIGENRDQEARAKIAELAQHAVEWQLPPLRWHFVGTVQTNKARFVARYAHVVHSVDRPSLVTALDAAAHRAGRTLDVFAQVSLDAQPGRGGVLPGELLALADQIAAASALRLRGVMAIAPLDADPDPAFARLAELSAQLAANYPDAIGISAGMSGDLEAAIRHGATHVRIGTALLGRRSVNVG